MRKTCFTKGNTGEPKQRANAPTRKPLFSLTARALSIFYLCQTEKCDVHNRVTRYQPTPQEQAQRKKEALTERVEKLSRVRVLEAIRKKRRTFSPGQTWRW
jgi:hypothetical protein